MPTLLRAPCRASYPQHLVTIFTQLPEIDSVVDYIRKETGRNKVSLACMVSFSSRFGLYAALHPEKVEGLAIVGPGYRRDAPSEFPIWNTVAGNATRTDVPRFSFLLRTTDEIFAAWDRQRRCQDTVEPGIRDALANAIRTYADPGAGAWGNPPAAFYRVPTGSGVDAGWGSIVGVARERACSPRRRRARSRSAEEAPKSGTPTSGRRKRSCSGCNVQRTSCCSSGITRRCTTRSRSS